MPASADDKCDPIEMALQAGDGVDDRTAAFCEYKVGIFAARVGLGTATYAWVARVRLCEMTSAPPMMPWRKSPL
jgi:hypothetical protein